MTDPISIREYVDTRFKALEQTLDRAIDSAEKAVDKAQAATEKRFEGVNEFRASLNDHARMMMPRSEAEQALKTLNERVDRLTTAVESRVSVERGRSDVWGWIAAVVGLLLAVLMFIFQVVGNGH